MIREATARSRLYRRPSDAEPTRRPSNRPPPSSGGGGGGGLPVTPWPPGTELLMTVRLPMGTSPEPLHVYVSHYARARLAPRLAEKLALASYELLANALSYGSITGEAVFEFASAGHRVIVAVSNPTAAVRQRMLEDHVRKVMDNPAGIYAEEMERSVSGQGRRAMLGLARIRSEAAMDLELATRKEWVCLRASAVG